KAVHLKIAHLLLKETPDNILEEKIFDIVRHFNHSIDLLTNQTERLEIAKLNLLAGQKAKMATAYESAVSFLTIGKECLPEKSWETEYDLTLNLFTEATEVAYLNGDYEQMEQLSKIVLQQAQTLSDEAKICEILIYSYNARNQQLRAIKTTLIFLQRLGIDFPEEPSQEDIGLALQKIQVSLSDKLIPSLIDLPKMTNTNMILAMRIMITIMPATYHVAPQLMVLLIVKQVELSLKYGNVFGSSVSYAFYGFVLTSVIGNIELGYQFGQLALNLSKISNERGMEAWVTFLFNCLIKHWKKHVRDTLQPMLESYQISLETGNIEFAAYSIHNYSEYSYSIGKPLNILEPELAQYCHAIARIKQEVQLGWNYLYWQVVLNLMGHSNNPCILVGTAYDENIQLPLHKQANDRTAIHFLHLNKCILHYLFQEYAPAFENAKIAEQNLDGVTGLLTVAICYFYDSLAQLALYPTLSSPEQEAVLTKVFANQEKMKLWAEHAPMNYQHKYDLVEAEKARVLGKNWKAAALYEKSIAGAKENQYIQEEALAYELAAKFYLERGMDKFSQVYLRDANYCYQQWGATAKVKQLEAKYPQLLTTITPKNLSSNVTIARTVMSSNATQMQTSTVLDLDSITKASQTLTGEINLSKLLERMMHIVIENAGAERGFLLLPQDDKWFIEAEGSIDKQEVTILNSLPIEQYLPEAIISYVGRTKENVRLDNASQEGLYAENSYIKTHQTQSVLCFPIVYQRQLRAILYFENNLTTGAFTPQRLKVLTMLSSQIAISLENAQVMANLDGKVKERTTQLNSKVEELTQTRQELVQSEKM
ncbi:MAG: GAF domain-containing protein, partial [Candidatus Marithrix sp.]|nr:GAF domain-containing protein [Candidatus Marithrix sp.]